MKTQIRKKRRIAISRKEKIHARAPTDKAQLREMLEAYKVWNIEKDRARIEAARNRTPTEAFESFLDLWEFGRSFASHSAWGRQEKLESLQRGAERMKRFEEWRRAHAN